MGDYNPYRPQILGQEWVPIRDENLELSPATNFVEDGHQFTLTTARILSQGRYYVNHIPHDADEGQHMGIAVYPAGLEDQSGPVESIIIPVSSAICTGGTPSGDVTARLLTPTNFQGGVTFSASSATTMGIRMQFALNRYPQLLGKRILGVNVLYVANGDDSLVGPQLGGNGATQLVMTTEFDAVPTTNYVGYERLHSTPSNEIVRVPLGEINPFWTATSPVSTIDRMHWTWPQLLRLDTVGALPKLFITVATGTAVNLGAPTGTVLFFFYAALEVFYCEEQRTAFGAVQLGTDLNTLGKKSAYGANIITMRDMTYGNFPTLPAGNYTAVLTSPFVGQTNYGFAAASAYPFLNAERELYGLPSHPGVQVNLPFPMDPTADGDTLTTTTLHVLPQLSLHASGGTLTEPHVYGRQGAAQVYGVNTATQEIYDDVVGGSASYPQVRYVARRFGDTTQPLVLTGTGSLAASTVSITVAEFDALTEIIDGWKEITLRFAVPPTMGALVSPEPSWTWSSTAETAGNRWEILAACAPAVSGTPGNLLNLVTPAAFQLYEATYQPPAGAQAELTWMPQGVGSPYVTGATEDDSCDAFLIFSQDPPTVTGVGLTAQTQAVTGLGFNCGSLPCCIPSGISYQTVTWSPVTIGVSGFGAYELQRFDTTPGADFETIMLASSPYVTGFNDFEARVGVDSVYRIRSLNVYNFAGAWSTQVTGGIPSPGVTGGCDDATGALIFTSNADQTGASNAAYMMQWDGEPVEDFGLPEAEQVVFQAMYGRDGVVAFHGTERGLEDFSRVLLIHAAAVDPVRLADVKTLRDLAWADLPYVCVRDDIADRWFANVQVPTVNARFNRTTYMARVDIREVTQTPYAVDP